jgi:hypothetical protein
MGAGGSRHDADVGIPSRRVFRRARAFISAR